MATVGKSAKPATAAGWSPEPAHPPLVTPAPRPVRRRVRWRDREGFYELRVDAALSTTRQGEVLNLALASAPTTHRRLLFGKDVITEQWVYLDPFLAYADPTAPDHVSDVGVAVLGDVGSGKSACIKTHFLMRTLLLGRYVVVLDKKLQGIEGEYAPIARLLGTEPVRFRLGGGGSRLNLLDPVIPIGLDLSDTDGRRRHRSQRRRSARTRLHRRQRRSRRRRRIDGACACTEGRCIRWVSCS